MGHIRYGIDNSPHEVIWDAKLKNLVIDKLEEMNDIEKKFIKKD